MSLLQHEQSQVFASPLPCAVGAADCAAPSLFFIGQESPLQQSQLSQHDALSAPAPSFFFSGHESPEQQQHDATADAENVARENASAAIDSPRTAKMAKAIKIDLFMIYYLSNVETSKHEPLRFDDKFNDVDFDVFRS